MADLMDRLNVVVRFECADGSVIERLWTNFMVLNGDGPQLERLNDVGPWLQRPCKAWPHPQDPISFTGRVAEGHEDEARAWVASL